MAYVHVRELVLKLAFELTSLQMAPHESEGGVAGGVGKHTAGAGGGGWRARKRFSITANSATLKPF